MAKRICKVCQTKYSYCPHCEAYINKPYWMFMFHDENCKKIFDTLQRYSTKEYTAAQALKILNECDLMEKDSFAPSILADLNKLLARKKPVKKIVNKNIENS